MNNYKSIYWSQLKHEDWSLYIAATEEGLCFVGSNNQPFSELENWAASRLPSYTLVQDEEELVPYCNELIQYLQGKRDCFTVPFVVQGTPFQETVWRALRSIPFGQTTSYSDIAQHIGKPAAVRAVGTAIGANPVLIAVPCHRVIGKNGALTGYRGGIDMKTRLLELERK